MSECNPLADPCIASPQNAEEWSVCLPWGARLWRDAHGVHVQPGSPPADGVYGGVVVSNGCLVGVTPKEVALYEGAPCAAQPGACGVATYAAEPADITPSATPGNLYTLDVTGKPLVTCEVQSGDNVQVSGDGTPASPYRISADTGDGLEVVQALAGNDAVEVEGNGTAESILKISHKLGKQTTSNGLVFDEYGHLVDTTSISVSPVTAVLGNDGITAINDPSTGVTTVSLSSPANPVQGSYDLGAYKVGVDAKGRLSSISQQVNLESDITFRAGTHDISLNTLGGVTDIQNQFSLGAFYLLIFPPSAGDVTTRWAAFNLVYSSPLAGRLLPAVNQELPVNLAIKIDDILCDTQALQDGSVLFWLPSVCLAGEHRLNVLAGETPWAEGSTITALLAPAEFATATGEE